MNKILLKSLLVGIVTGFIGAFIGYYLATSSTRAEDAATVMQTTVIGFVVGEFLGIAIAFFSLRSKQASAEQNNNDG